MKMLSPILIALILLDAIARPAHAYLDPGIGSHAMQVGMASLLGALYLLRGAISRMVNALPFRRRK
jgi:hypothetical protein